MICYAMLCCVMSCCVCILCHTLYLSTCTCIMHVQYLKRQESYRDLMAMLAVGDWENSLRGSYPGNRPSSQSMHGRPATRAWSNSRGPNRANNTSFTSQVSGASRHPLSKSVSGLPAHTSPGRHGFRVTSPR